MPDGELVTVPAPCPEVVTERVFFTGLGDGDGLGLGLGVGVGVGVGLGLIFAPKSGEETRELLKGKADEGKEYLKRRGSELRDSAGEIIERGKEVISRQKDTLAEAVEAGKQAYREAVGQPAGAESQMAR